MRHGHEHINKPTKEEHRERVQAVYNLLRQRQSKRHIVYYLRQKYGVVTRTADRYITKAREMLRAETGQSKQDHVVDAYTFYSSIVADLKQPVSARISAQQSIDKLLGLSAPTRIAQTDAAGNDVSPESIRSELAAIISEFKQLERPGETEASANQDASAR